MISRRTASSPNILTFAPRSCAVKKGKAAFGLLATTAKGTTQCEQTDGSCQMKTTASIVRGHAMMIASSHVDCLPALILCNDSEGW